jgi:hypothetical protein
MRSCRVVALHQVDGIPTVPNVQDQAATRRDDLRYGARGRGAYRARLAVDSRTRPDSAGRNEDLPQTMCVLVRDRSCWVAGQGFEPWKASADGFTVRSTPARTTVRRFRIEAVGGAVSAEVTTLDNGIRG